jgi:hypothetical protein
VTFELGKNVCQILVFFGVILLTGYGVYSGSELVTAVGAVGGLGALFLEKVKF